MAASGSVDADTAGAMDHAWLRDMLRDLLHDTAANEGDGTGDGVQKESSVSKTKAKKAKAQQTQCQRRCRELVATFFDLFVRSSDNPSGSDDDDDDDDDDMTATPGSSPLRRNATTYGGSGRGAIVLSAAELPPMALRHACLAAARVFGEVLPSALVPHVSTLTPLLSVAVQVAAASRRVPPPPAAAVEQRGGDSTPSTPTPPGGSAAAASHKVDGVVAPIPVTHQSPRSNGGKSVVAAAKASRAARRSARAELVTELSALMLHRALPLLPRSDTELVHLCVQLYCA